MQIRKALSETSTADPRVGHFVKGKAGVDKNTRAVIIGFPTDEGVVRNGGRAGAADAPYLVRELLYALTPPAQGYDHFTSLLRRTADVGDIRLSGCLERDQELLGEELAKYIKLDIIPVIIGGGHETAFGHFLGHALCDNKISIINIDAHADVRELKNGKPHSGSPFRQALEHESMVIDKYTVAGLQPHAVSREHVRYIEAKNGECVFKPDTDKHVFERLFNEDTYSSIMASFDMDAVNQSEAPGVSAPCTNGLTADTWLAAVHSAGRCRSVVSFDLSEINPQVDRQQQTSRLGALTIWHFFLGLSQRFSL